MPVVANTPTADYDALADEIATDRGEAVVRSIEAADAGTLLLVTDPSDLTDTTVYALSKRLRRLGPDDGAFGIVTGHTAEEARDLYYRETDEELTGHGLLLGKQSNSRSSSDGDTEIRTKGNLTTDAVTNIVEGGVSSLSMHMSGRSLHTYLDDGYICGYPSDFEPATDDDGFQAPCVTEDGRDCPLDGDLLFADDIDANHVFVGSCSSLVPKHTKYGVPVHTGLGLLRNAVSLVGGYRHGGKHRHEAILNYALLRSGYSAIERCYVLNRNSESVGLESHPYLVFGDPDAEPAEKPIDRYDVQLAESGDEVELVLEDVSAHVVDVSYTDPNLDHRSAPPTLAVPEEIDQRECRYTSFFEGDQIRFVIYAEERLEADSLRFEIRQDPPLEADAVGTIRQTVRNLNHLLRYQIGGEKVRSDLRTLENVAGDLSNAFELERIDPHARPELQAEFDAVFDRIRETQAALGERLNDRSGQFLRSDYGGNTVQTEVSSADNDCVNCGRPTFSKVMVHPAGQIPRLSKFCPSCVDIYDVPVTDPMCYPTIEGDFYFDSRGTRSFEVEFTNPYDVPMVTTIRPWFWVHRDSELNDAECGLDVFDPTQSDVTLSPGETYVETFDLHCPDVNPDLYAVWAYVIGNGQVFGASADVTVAPE